MGNTPPTSLKAKPPKSDASSSSSSPPRIKKDPKEERKIEAKTTTGAISRKSPSGEAWSFAPLPEVLEAIVNDYLAGDFDVSGYSFEDCKSFTLFRKNAVPAFIATIATHALHGRRTEAVEAAKKHPESLICITQARDPFGRLAEGSPVDLAAAAGNRRLTEELMKLVPEKLQSEAKRHLARRFHPGWEKETQDRMKQCYLDPLIRFTDQLEKAKKLPKDIPFKQAILERKAMIDEFRVAIRPKPDDAPITTGLIFDPEVYSDIDQLFLNRKDDLGDWYSPESDLFWGVGYQSLLGAGSAVIAHVVISGANNYFDHHRDPVEAVIFKDGTLYFLDNPAAGIGVDFVVSFYGVKYGDTCPSIDDWGAWHWRVGNHMSSKNINIAELMLLQDNPLTIRMEL